jgi:hypothetical protein
MHVQCTLHRTVQWTFTKFLSMTSTCPSKFHIWKHSCSVAPSWSKQNTSRTAPHNRHTHLFSMVSSPPYFSPRYSRIAPLSNRVMSPSTSAGIRPKGLICRAGNQSGAVAIQLCPTLVRSRMLHLEPDQTLRACIRSLPNSTV